MGWIAADKALKSAPFCSGVYKIGIQRRSSIETIYIGVTKTGGSLRETLLKLFAGVEGEQSLMEYVSSAWNKKHIKIDWTIRSYPKDDVNDFLRDYIRHYRTVPMFNKRALDDSEPYIILEPNVATPDNFP